MYVSWIIVIALLIVLYFHSLIPRQPDYVYVVTKHYLGDIDIVLVFAKEKDAKDAVELRNKEIVGFYYKYWEMELDG